MARTHPHTHPHTHTRNGMRTHEHDHQHEHTAEHQHHPCTAAHTLTTTPDDSGGGIEWVVLWRTHPDRGYHTAVVEAATGNAATDAARTRYHLRDDDIHDIAARPAAHVADPDYTLTPNAATDHTARDRPPPPATAWITRDQLDALHHAVTASSPGRVSDDPGDGDTTIDTTGVVTLTTPRGTVAVAVTPND